MWPGLAYKDIPAVVEEMRQYWMPTRFKEPIVAAKRTWKLAPLTIDRAADVRFALEN
jgi:hypothetical protein